MPAPIITIMMHTYWPYVRTHPLHHIECHHFIIYHQLCWRRLRCPDYHDVCCRVFLLCSLSLLAAAVHRPQEPEVAHHQALSWSHSNVVVVVSALLLVSISLLSSVPPSTAPFFLPRVHRTPSPSLPLLLSSHSLTSTTVSCSF